ncbi:hypothetical protein DPMN_115912 [Dreissena polymorpha]|uniref:Uncharacterized protein n=1 Tax=Dreissena polymorpha TaxID=45954 RepID=A0A9D4QSX6_DREPO|nr:hypothetical protein DPMN_115912 [Dreissena polymorpha]
MVFFAVIRGRTPYNRQRRSTEQTQAVQPLARRRHVPRRPKAVLSAAIRARIPTTRGLSEAGAFTFRSDVTKKEGRLPRGISAHFGFVVERTTSPRIQHGL